MDDDTDFGFRPEDMELINLALVIKRKAKRRYLLEQREAIEDDIEFLKSFSLLGSLYPQRSHEEADANSNAKFDLQSDIRSRGGIAVKPAPWIPKEDGANDSLVAGIRLMFLEKGDRMSLDATMERTTQEIACSKVDDWMETLPIPENLPIAVGESKDGLLGRTGTPTEDYPIYEDVCEQVNFEQYIRLPEKPRGRIRRAFKETKRIFPVKHILRSTSQTRRWETRFRFPFCN